MKEVGNTLNILVSAGPTREPIDLVRFISNYSTGFLGYALAKEAKRRGHRVILISGPTQLVRPKGVVFVKIETARQLQKALARRFSWCDCLIMTAAVGDFRARTPAKRKIKRSAGKELSLRLTQNTDILRGLAAKKGNKMLVGFSLETEDLQKNARRKLSQKRLDLIVATPMKTGTYPFGPAMMDVLIMDKEGRIQQIKRANKSHLARILLDRIERDIL